MLPFALATLCSLAPLQDVAPTAARPAQGRVVPLVRPGGLALISGFNSDAIHVFDAASGAFLQLIAPVPGAQSVVTGPDGLLYACAEKVDEILRIDPATLLIVDAFVADDPLTPGDETGGLDGPTGALFGPDGNLYVASFETDQVLRFDGRTGAFLDVFVTAASGGLNGPDAGLTFGPDGNLYVPSFWNGRVLRYDGTTGAFLDVFVVPNNPAPGVLSRPRAVAFRGPYCFVASSGNNRVLRYDLSGAFLDRFVVTNEPYSIAFHPDDGNLYSVSLGRNELRAYDGDTGGLVRVVVPQGGAGGLDGAVWVHFLVP